MICLASFIVFGILGIFSANQREMAFEAYNCMLDRITRGECDADFEDQVRASIVGSALDRSPMLASFLENHLETLSVIFVLVFILSGLWVLKSVVFFGFYGSCQGPYDPCFLTNQVKSLL